MKTSENEDGKWLVILQTIPDLLFLIDRNGRFKSFLNQDQKGPAFSYENYTGKTIPELLEPELADQFMLAVRETLRTGSYEQEYQMGNGDGRYFSARYSRLNEEEVICSARDITAQKETENRLRKALENQQKFCSIVAHDLRGPISNFLPVLDILTREELDEETRIDYLEELKKASTSTFNLLENLLNWSRLQSCTLQLKPSHFVVNQLITDNIELLQSGARQKSITVTHCEGDPLPVYADRNSVNLVLRNLLNNALKFTPREGQITISARQGGAMVEVEVADTGVGIPEELIPTIFDKKAFYTTYGTEHEKGSGLGLILAREFLGKNGGEIGVDSQEGRGSRFWFTLPAGVAQACHPEEQKMMNLVPGKWLAGKHVLLVEDDLFSQHFGRNMLSSWQMTVDTAADGAEALKLLEENHYDLILMDIEMPVLNGYETIGKIRGEKKLATPVIALSASVSDLTVTSAISFGFDDFLVKPFKPGELLSKLARWFNVEHITGQHTGGTNRPNGKKADPSSGAASGPDGMKIIPAVKPAPGLNGHAVETLQPRYSDTARLAHALGGDPALVRKMIASFLEITPAYYRDLMTAFALHKPQTVGKLAHKLKSSVALLGVRKTVDNLEEIQAASRDPLRHHELNSLLDFFKTWYPQLCGELQESL